MKYAIVIPDGCADEPLEQLAGRTPLQAANLPGMDAIVRTGVVGRANNVPAHLTPGSDVATLSLLGYDPNKHYTGRAPLEAAAQGIHLGANDWAIRCNLVTIRDQIMQDFTAGHISDCEARQLLATAQQELGSATLEFVPGVSYRNLLLYRGTGGSSPFAAETRSVPPHDLTDKSVIHHYPRGPGSDLLDSLMRRSLSLFAEHPVNRARVANGQSPATNVWLWGIGQAPQLASFRELHGKTGKMITAVDLLRGIAAIIGWDRIDVAGATGYTDTDYAGKGKAAVAAISSTDVICVHIEATDEASHEGDAAAKVKALEAIDQHIVQPLHTALAEQGPYRILVSPDHPTPIRTKTHSHGFVPFAIAGTGISPDDHTSYDEESAAQSSLGFSEGWKLMTFFLGQ
jgi:2,3-bisphosphoglycerate-independent phosphoglycerate mutase